MAENKLHGFNQRKYTNRKFLGLMFIVIYTFSRRRTRNRNESGRGSELFKVIVS